MKFIVMAGGQGTRLWPLSREKMPKQFQKIVGEKTLFENNVETLLQRYQPEDIFVSTNEEYLSVAREQAPFIPEENFIVEPTLKKDTGPATGYAVLKVSMKYPDEPIMFYVQPVVIRTPQEKYLEMIEGIENLIVTHKKLISGGMRPLYPDVGSDYLRLDKQVDALNNLEVYEVDKFVHRLGDYNKTKELISHFKVSTHCNHYSWYPSQVLDAIKKYRPDWFEVLMKIKGVIGTENEFEKIKEFYAEFTPGRMEEVTEKVFDNKEGLIVILPFKWVHISTWDDLYEYSVKKDSNHFEGEVIDIDVKNSYVKSLNKKVIAVVGVENIVVVDTPDALLICDKDKTVDVKKVLEELKKIKREDLL